MVFQNHRSRSTSTNESDAAVPSRSWIFAQLLLGKPIPNLAERRAEEQRKREQLEWLASISERHAKELRALRRKEAEAQHQRELLEWLASFSERHAIELRKVRQREVEARDAELFINDLLEHTFDLSEADWDESKHPRRGGPPNAGWWASTGGGGSNVSNASYPKQADTRPLRADQTRAQLAGFAARASTSTWTSAGSLPSWLPKVGVRPGTSAAAAAGIVFGAIADALRNAGMGAYWGRMPPKQAMPYVWVWELERRVRAGTLSRDDAREIFNTAVLGADAQGFIPTGDRNSAVHRSAADFLAKAERHFWSLRAAKKAGNIPLSRQPEYQGTYRAWDSTQKRMRETSWWEYKDQDGKDKIVVEHDDGTWHVGKAKPDSKHRTGEGPPKYTSEK